MRNSEIVLTIRRIFINNESNYCHSVSVCRTIFAREHLVLVNFSVVFFI